jgi:formylmethanofuran dehydrogenase subunit E
MSELPVPSPCLRQPEADLPRLAEILALSARDHAHLCPRQILGARMGLAGTAALGFDQPPPGKRLLIIVETDGCFLDGLSAATGCTPGHRTLRIEDYGKTAAAFVDVRTGRAVRVAPRLDVRDRAWAHAPAGVPRYSAQMQAYQVMPAEELFTFTPVRLGTSIEAIVSRPGVRVCCAACGEEVMNERTVDRDGAELCLACARGGYCAPVDPDPGRV